MNLEQDEYVSKAPQCIILLNLLLVLVAKDEELTKTAVQGIQEG